MAIRVTSGGFNAYKRPDRPRARKCSVSSSCETRDLGQAIKGSRAQSFEQICSANASARGSVSCTIASAMNANGGKAWQRHQRRRGVLGVVGIFGINHALPYEIRKYRFRAVRCIAAKTTRGRGERIDRICLLSACGDSEEISLSLSFFLAHSHPRATYA